MTRQEFEHTLSGTRGKLLGTARRFMRVSDAEVEDIVQEAMTELWMLFDNGYPIRNAEALAVKITKTVCVKHYRQRKMPARQIEGGATASERVDIQDALNVRKVLLGQLSETQKRYLSMRSEQMMSLDEIAAAKEFDAIMDSRNKRKRLVRWACGVTAAVAVMVCAGALLSH